MNRPEYLANRLRNQLGIPDDEKLSSLDLLRRLKFARVIEDFRESPARLMDGRDAFWDEPSRSILLSPKLWEQVHETNESSEARFTVVHEAGHAVLGHTSRNRMRGGAQQFGRAVEPDEIEADAFARAFVVPLQFAKVATSVTVLVDRFGMPADQADQRLVDLERHIRASGQVESEPDTDNYAEAMSAMRINALNWNR